MSHKMAYRLLCIGPKRRVTSRIQLFFPACSIFLFVATFHSTLEIQTSVAENTTQVIEDKISDNATKTVCNSSLLSYARSSSEYSEDMPKSPSNSTVPNHSTTEKLSKNIFSNESVAFHLKVEAPTSMPENSNQVIEDKISDNATKTVCNSSVLSYGRSSSECSEDMHESPSNSTVPNHSTTEKPSKNIFSNESDAFHLKVGAQTSMPENTNQVIEVKISSNATEAVCDSSVLAYARQSTDCSEDMSESPPVSSHLGTNSTVLQHISTTEKLRSKATNMCVNMLNRTICSPETAPDESRCIVDMILGVSVWFDLKKCPNLEGQHICGVKPPRKGWRFSGIWKFVTDGRDAYPGDWPWMAALGYKDPQNESKPLKWRCGGTLISSTHVITAAHCVTPSEVSQLY